MIRKIMWALCRHDFCVTLYDDGTRRRRMYFCRKCGKMIER
nr:MAG TPA: putative zinc-ribbon domain protein [Caudoviricetes sp.]